MIIIFEGKGSPQSCVPHAAVLTLTHARTTNPTFPYPFSLHEYTLPDIDYRDPHLRKRGRNADDPVVIRFKSAFHNTVFDVMKKRGWKCVDVDLEWDIFWWVRTCTISLIRGSGKKQAVATTSVISTPNKSLTLINFAYLSTCTETESINKKNFVVPTGIGRTWGGCPNGMIQPTLHRGRE